MWFIKLIINLLWKSPKSTHMGVSKGEGGGRWSPPNGWRSLVLGEGDPCRIWRSGGFPNFPGKSSPSSPSFLLLPLFLPFDPSSNSFTPQNPPFTSLDRAVSPFLPSLPSFSSSDSFLFPVSPFLSPYRTLTEHLRNPSIGPPKGPERPKKALLRAF